MAKAKPTVRIYFVRHGETRYSGVFPDITEEAQEHIRTVVAPDIASWRKRAPTHCPFRIVTSPAPRAHGTATEIDQALEYRHPEGIPFVHELRAMDWIDPQLALLACRGLSGKGYIHYETEPVFQDPAIFEQQDSIRHRLFTWMRFLFNSWGIAQSPFSVVAVTHYEVLCHLTQLCGIVPTAETALRYAESIQVESSDLGAKDVRMTIHFRGQVYRDIVLP